MIRDALLRAWLRLRGGLQWRLLWLANPKFMLSVAGVICNERGELLLLRHRYHVGDGWGLPGGIVRSGEKLEEALAREVREETGLEIDQVRLLQIASGYRLRLEVYYQARLAGGELRLQASEILEAGFFSPGCLPSRLSAVNRQVIAQALSGERALNLNP